jgi:hypothetical protein
VTVAISEASREEAQCGATLSAFGLNDRKKVAGSTAMPSIFVGVAPYDESNVDGRRWLAVYC